MALDYSKWDGLELSDDPDFECHPNVDKASMIRWKQADIHRKRRDLKDTMATLREEINLISVTMSDLNTLKEKVNDTAIVDSSQRAELMSLVDRYRGKVSTSVKNHDENYLDRIYADRDSRWGEPQRDELVMSRVDCTPKIDELRVIIEKKDSESTVDTTSINEILAILDALLSSLVERDAKIKAFLDEKERELKKKITAEDVRVGFDRTLIVHKSPEKEKAPESQVEDLGAANGEDEDLDDDEEEVKINPIVKHFSELRDMGQSKEYLMKHRKTLLNMSNSDWILAKAFMKIRQGHHSEAKDYIIQSALLQYCTTIGKDGPEIFFSRAESTKGESMSIFYQDVTDIYNRICERVNVLKKNEMEKIKKQKLNDTPEIREKREKLLASLTPELQKSILEGDIDGINNYLATLSTEEGERVVNAWNEVGIVTLKNDKDDI